MSEYMIKMIYTFWPIRAVQLWQHSLKPAFMLNCIVKIISLNNYFQRQLK